MRVRSVLLHMALVWLGKGISLSVCLPVVINYPDIALAQSVRGLLDRSGGSSKSDSLVSFKRWTLISPRNGPSGDLFCLCRPSSAGTCRALAVGEQAGVGQPLTAPWGQICANYTTNYTVGCCAP